MMKKSGWSIVIYYKNWVTQGERSSLWNWRREIKLNKRIRPGLFLAGIKWTALGNIVKGCEREGVKLLLRYNKQPFDNPVWNQSRLLSLDWGFGCVQRARFYFREQPAQNLLRILLHSSASRFLNELQLIEEKVEQGAKYDLIDVFNDIERKSLRKLLIRRKVVGDTGIYSGTFPGLEELTLKGQSITLKKLNFDKLKSLDLETSTLDAASARALERARLPALESFSFILKHWGRVCFGDLSPFF